MKKNKQENINKREAEIIKFIQHNLSNKGYPPSVREIGAAVGLKSSSSVHNYLHKLESKGLLRRDPAKPRAIELLFSQHAQNTLDEVPFLKDVSTIPILGTVAAGAPLLAVENHDDVFSLPTDFTGEGEFFMLKVRGDSMIEAGILENDLVLVKRQASVNNGEIVVALIEDEVTVKTFYKEDDHIRLQPENYRLSPILVKDMQILGKVTGLVRKI